MSEVIHFSTVGQLRKALEGVPDDRPIICQVVAADHGAWNMHGSFCPQIQRSNMACVALAHPDLKTMPRFPDQPKADP